MRETRRIVMHVVLVATALLLALSIVGAFLGAEGARALFNSQPMVVFWMLLGALLLVGFVYFPKLIRSPGGLAVHLGSVLVLFGGMAGSARGHAVAARILGDDRVFQGYMRIEEGESSDAVYDEEGELLTSLPFKIRLEDFRIERYPSGDRWRLGVDAPPTKGEHQRRSAEIDWAPGEVVEIPFVDATLEVLRYLPSARPTFEEGVRPELVVTEASGRRTKVPAEVGREVTLEDPPRSLKIVQLFSHLRVTDEGVVDVPGSDANPAVKVELRGEDGPPTNRYAFAKGMMSGHGMGDDGLVLTYAVPSESGAVEDADTGLPAMEVLVRGPGGEEHEWLVARSQEQPVAISLAEALGPSDGRMGGPHHQNGAFLILAASQGNVRDYLSDLTVLDAGDEVVARQVIEVNDPLHFGGYHFYQHSFDSRAERYTVLGVRSDLGLTTVYVGFTLLCLGAAWLFWVTPIRKRFAGERTNGN